MLSLQEFKSKMQSTDLAVWPFVPEIETLWHFDLQSRRSELWPYLTDTSRLNREMGFGAREQNESGGKLRVKTKILGLEQIWLEEPWTWIENQVITCTRNYEKGLGQKMFSVFYLEENSRGTRVYVYFGWIARGFLWRKFLQATSGILQKSFASAFAKIDASLIENRGRAVKALSVKAPAPDAEVAKRLTEIRSELEAGNFESALVTRFLDHLVTGDSFDLEPLRALPLARAWSIDSATMVALCLQSIRLGALKISWDVICPHCRGSRYSAESLGSIPDSANCDVCEIDFTTSDENSIEVLFHVHPSLRDIQAVHFCAAEPAKKVHIRAQQLISATSEINLRLDLAPGFYRARLVGQSSEMQIEVDPAADASSTATFTNSRVKPSFTLNCANKNSRPALLVLEELKWESDALRPGVVFANPEFRDIFAKEHLSSNVKLFLGTQTILFTDIVGSTNFYTRVGDAKAFAEVRSHFQELFKIMSRHKGVVVKTIGDAVMASFTNAESAIAAGLEIQNQFHDKREDTTIRLRISIHSGSVIAVELNTGLDYFGSTVNYAAKIQSCAGAGEIALSEKVYAECVKAGAKYTIVKRQNSRDDAAKTDVFVLQVAGAKTS